MPELALGDVDRGGFAGELDRVHMPKLVRREPPPDPSVGGELAQLVARGDRGPPAPAGGPSITQNSGLLGSRVEPEAAPIAGAVCPTSDPTLRETSTLRLSS